MRDTLDRDGFAVVRSVVPAGELRAVSDAFDRLVARARTLPGTTDIDGTRFVVDASPFRVHRVVWCGGAEPVLGAYGGDPRFVALASAVLGTDPVVQLIQQAHFKLPGDEVAFAWHQDASNRRYGTDLFTDVDGRGSFVQLALAVDPMGPENGGLAFLPGSHRAGFVADVETGALPPGRFDAGTAIAPQLAAGDVVLFGPFTVHGSEPNRSGIARRLFLQGYAAPGANRRVYPGCGAGVERWR